ncbi:MAG TPA: SpoIIE family protein phosphatase [Thermoanaerobaculia bacterium]|nr:SpoIIE family protein phosphatase [Thermoanaerobaculia bacterium]
MPHGLKLVPRGPSVLTGEVTPGERPLQVGRETSCDVVIPDPAVSRRHARLLWEGSELVLEDLGSTGGTFRNGAPVDRCVLRPGDVVRFGRHAEYAVEAEPGTSILQVAAQEAARQTGGDDEVRQLKTLLEVARTLHSATVLDEVLDLVLGSAARLMRADRALLSLTGAASAATLISHPRASGGIDPREELLLERALRERTTVAGPLAPAPTDSTLGGEVGEAAATPLFVVRRPLAPVEQASFIGQVEMIGALLVQRREARGGFRPDELAVLESLAADAAMAIDSARLYREAREKAKIDHEMELARSIQVHLLRLPPAVPFAEVVGLSEPARRVGGDLYHGALRPDGVLALAVGDISGKGVSAALLMALLQGLLELLHDLGRPLAEVLPALDRTLRRYNPGNRFLTLAVALLGPGGEVELANAGHCPLALLRRDGSFERIGSLGPVLGLLPAATWRTERRTLAPGDTLVLYSDGIPESAAPDGRELGDAGVDACLRPLAGTAPQQIAECLLQAAAAHRGGSEAEDDVTLLVARYTGA